MTNKLMTHVVAGYPTYEKCIQLLLGMQAAGVYAIEVQIPFTDPSADGPTIMKANDIALKNGMQVSNCFELIRETRAKGLVVPVYIMTYANKVYHFGFEQFCKEATKIQVQGLIIPDLPFDTPEYAQLSKLCTKHKLELVPVVSPGIAVNRLAKYQVKSQGLVYVTSSKGITGNSLHIQNELIATIRQISLQTDCQIALGFGIRYLEHVQQALGIADIAVVGSVISEMVEKKGIDDTLKLVRRLVGTAQLH